MRKLLRFALLVLCMTAVPATWAANVNGTWTGSFDLHGGAIAVTFNLKSDGDKVTGTVEGLPTSPAEIHDGKLSGDTVSFWLNTDYQGQTYKIVYQGKVATDQIDFTFGTEDGQWSSPLTVKKSGTDTPGPANVPPGAAPDSGATASAVNIDGDWKGSFEFEGGQVPVTFHLKHSGAEATGTIDGMGSAPIDIHEGKLTGDSLTFWANTDYQGQTYMLTYKGKVSTDRIDFTFGTVDGGWNAAVTAKKTP